MHKRTKRFTGLAVIAAAAIALTACSAPVADVPPEKDQSWEAIVERAKQEGMVNFYTGMAPVENDLWIEEFNELYPEIEVVVTRGAFEMMTRIDAEIAGNTDGADLVMTSLDSWYLANLDNLAEVRTPESANWPDEAWLEKGTVPTVVMNAAGFLIWNTDKVPDGLKTWEDLRDADINGVAMYDNAANSLMAGIMDMLTEEYGDGYLEDIADKGTLPFPSVVPIAESVSSGEASAAVVSSPALIMDLKESGAPIDFAYPDPTFAVGQLLGLLKKSQRPNAALVFADFLLSRTGQTVTNSKGFSASPAFDDIDGQLDASTFTLKDETRLTPEVVKDWDQRYDEVFGP